MAIDWMTIDKAKGDGDSTLGVSVSENALTVSRNARIKITSTDGTIVKYVSVIQEGKEQEETLTINPSSFTVAYNDTKDKEIVVTATADWTVDVPDWITVLDTGGSMKYFDFRCGTLDGATRVGEIKFYINGKLKATATVTQTTNYVITVDGLIYSIPKAGGDDSGCRLYSSKDWWVKSKPDWVSSVSPDSGSAMSKGSTKTITISAGVNYQSAKRTGYVVFTNGYADAQREVIQKGSENPSIILSPDPNLLEYTGGTVELSVYSDVLWSLSCDLDSVTFSKTEGYGDDKVTLTIPVYEQLGENRTITITATSRDDTWKGGATAEIIQRAAVCGISGEDTVTIKRNMIGQVYYFYSPCGFTVSEHSDFITVSPESQTDITATQRTVQVKNNPLQKYTEFVDREGSFILKDNEGNEKTVNVLQIGDHNDTIDASPKSLVYDVWGEEKQVIVYCSTDGWNMTVPDWLTGGFSGTGSKGFTTLISRADINYDSSKKEGAIIFTDKDGNTVEVSVTQKAFQPLPTDNANVLWYRTIDKAQIAPSFSAYYEQPTSHIWDEDMQAWKITFENEIITIPYKFMNEKTTVFQVGIPYTAIEIMDFAFYKCSNLRTVYLNEGNRIQAIWYEGLGDCSLLVMEDIPSNVKYIGGCGMLTQGRAMTKFVFSPEIRYFDYYAMGENSKVSDVYFYGSQQPSYSGPTGGIYTGHTFTGLASTGTVHTPTDGSYPDIVVNEFPSGWTKQSDLTAKTRFSSTSIYVSNDVVGIMGDGITNTVVWIYTPDGAEPVFSGDIIADWGLTFTNTFNGSTAFDHWYRYSVKCDSSTAARTGTLTITSADGSATKDITIRQSKAGNGYFYDFTGSDLEKRIYISSDTADISWRGYDINPDTYDYKISYSNINNPDKNTTTVSLSYKNDNPNVRNVYIKFDVDPPSADYSKPTVYVTVSAMDYNGNRVFFTVSRYRQSN